MRLTNGPKKTPKQIYQHSSFFSGYILSRTHHELDCQFMVGVSLSLSSPFLWWFVGGGVPNPMRLPHPGRFRIG